MLHIEEIAKVCHEANRAYCSINEDYSQPAWENAPDWAKYSAIVGVKYRLENPNASPEDQHNDWMEEKLAKGWTHGKEKNLETKEHPCLVAYKELGEKQKIKDELFIAIVKALGKAD
ncbi:MAG: RyR domain-containing protein [Xenococcaceae cyanobacterium]